jgi:hypothetical protein
MNEPLAVVLQRRASGAILSNSQSGSSPKSSLVPAIEHRRDPRRTVPLRLDARAQLLR